MEILQLKYFIGVVECGSVSEAARKFGVPQPSISQTIAKLERELGHKLFDRVNNRIVTNHNGQVFYEHARRALSELEGGATRIKDENGDAQTRITLVVTTEALNVIDGMLDFIKRRPEARFTVHHHLQSEGVDNPFDLCVTHHELDSDILGSVTLCKTELMLAVPPGNRLYDCDETVRPEMLTEEPIILTRPKGGIGLILGKYLAKHHIELSAQIVCNEPLYLAEFVASRAGVAVVSCPYRRLFPDDTRYLSFGDPDMCETVRLYWHNERYIPLMARAFRSELIERFKNCYSV